MSRFLLRRAGQAVVVLLGVSIAVFALVHLVDGDPIRTSLGTRFNQARYDALLEQSGLDRPLLEQYVTWLGSALTGDLGVSFRTTRPVTDVLGSRIWPTVQLAVAGLTIGVLVALPLGIAAARRSGGVVDRLITAGSQFGVAVPDFFLGIMLILVLSGWLGWLPTGGYRDPLDDFGGFVERLVMPALTVGLVSGAILTRFVRSSVLEALGQDATRTARSKGLPERTIVRRHVLRAAMVPIVTVTGLQLATLLGGVIVVEQVFEWPGLGREAMAAIRARDYPVLQGAVLLVAVGVLLVNLVVDVLYAVLDPRISRS